jgi:hypothetical protein
MQCALFHEHVMQRQVIDAGGQEALDGIFRGLDDGFALDVE